MNFLLRLVVNAAALWVATELVPGVSYTGGPLPFLVVALIVNGLMLWLTSTIAESLGLAFRVTGFWPAFWGALVVSIVSTLLSRFVAGPPSEWNARHSG